MLLSIQWPLLVLAVLQGATEFLPVSSSGHLALAQWLLGVGSGSVFEDVMLHLGTLGAVLVFYRTDIARLLHDGLRRGGEGDEARRYIGWILLGSVPAGVVGLFFASRVEASFEHIQFVVAALALTAVVLRLSDRLPRRQIALSARIAFLVGCAQALAVLPGFSRSGWTIVAGLALGLAPREAARFSFLLSIPAILGAALLQLGRHPGAVSSWPTLLVAMVVAFAVGLLCLRWLVALVQSMALGRFAWYLWAVSAAAVVGMLWL